MIVGSKSYAFPKTGVRSFVIECADMQMDAVRGLIRRRVEAVMSDVRAAEIAAGVVVGTVKIVAVAKKQPRVYVDEVLKSGINLIGESYVQEALKKYGHVGYSQNAKSEELPANSELHLIGRLQRNKVADSVGLFTVIQCVDRLALAQTISTVAECQGVLQRVYLQVNISGEQSKGGIAPEEVYSLFDSITKLPAIKVEGLMAVGRHYEQGHNDEQVMSDFDRLRNIREHIISAFGLETLELSMGMSDDFQLAISAGATMVRVGHRIFGDLPVEDV